MMVRRRDVSFFGDDKNSASNLFVSNFSTLCNVSRKILYFVWMISGKFSIGLPTFLFPVKNFNLRNIDVDVQGGPKK